MPETIKKKANIMGKTLLQKGFPHAPFPKTPKWVLSGHEPETESLTRTRPEEAYLGVLCGGDRGAVFLLTTFDFFSFEEDIFGGSL
jgi:hypothetical protein